MERDLGAGGSGRGWGWCWGVVGLGLRLGIGFGSGLVLGLGVGLVLSGVWFVLGSELGIKQSVAKQSGAVRFEGRGFRGNGVWGWFSGSEAKRSGLGRD